MASDSSDLFIVDDDAMMRDALSVVFTLAGYRVTGFVDGETFLAVAERSDTCRRSYWICICRPNQVWSCSGNWMLAAIPRQSLL